MKSRPPSTRSKARTPTRSAEDIFGLWAAIDAMPPLDLDLTGIRFDVDLAAFTFTMDALALDLANFTWGVNVLDLKP